MSILDIIFIFHQIIIVLPTGILLSTLYMAWGVMKVQIVEIMEASLQNGINSKEFPPVIVVFVNGRGNTFYSDSKDGTVKCESSIIKELIPKIDETYRTKADRTQRAIEGMSMGGFGTLMLGFKHPDMFASLGTYDAALVTWDTLSQQTFDQSIPKGIFGSDRQYFNENSYPFTFAKKNAETIKSLGIKVRMITGDNDFTMGPLYNYNCAMRDTLKKLNIDLVEFKIIKGGTHGSGMNATTIKENMILHTTNFKNATPVSNPSISLHQKNNMHSNSVTISKISSFHLPGQWHNSIDAATLYDLKGRNLGRIPMSGTKCIEDKMAQNKVLVFTC